MEAEEPVTDYDRLDPTASYTYLDYLKWQFTERVELIRGKIFKMSPGPNVNHQKISSVLHWSLASVFRKTSCRVFHAPFDVRLPIPKAEKDSTVVQPDLCIICDESKLSDMRGCNGAPDLVVEILSPGNTVHEMNTKFLLYQDSGVKEYWLVESAERAILVYTLQNGVYVGLRPFTEGMRLQSPLFPQLSIDVTEVFHDIK